MATDIDAATAVSGRTRSPARAWLAVTAAALVLACGTGFGFYALSAYASALIGLGRFELGVLSNAATVMMLSSGLLGVVMTRILDRVPGVVVMCVGAVMVGSGLSLIGTVTQVWQLFAVYLWCGVGMGAISVIPTTAVILRWFPDRPVRPLAVANSGLSVGGAVIAPLIASWLHSDGIEHVMPRLGIGVVAITITLIVLFLRKPPAIGGAPIDAGTVVPAAGRKDLLSPTFILVSVAFLLLMLAQVAVVTHLLTIAQERGIGDAESALVIIAATSIIGRVLTLPILGRVNSLSVAVVMAMIQATGVLLIAFAASSGAFSAAAVLVGVAVGNNVVLLPTCLHQLYGTANLTRYYSWANLATYVGTGGAPALLGLGVGIFGTYRVPLILIAGGSAVAGAILVALRISGRRRPRSATPPADPALISP